MLVDPELNSVFVALACLDTVSILVFAVFVGVVLLLISIDSFFIPSLIGVWLVLSLSKSTIEDIW